MYIMQVTSTPQILLPVRPSVIPDLQLYLRKAETHTFFQVNKTANHSSLAIS